MLLALVFAAACNGQVGDAISSVASGASVPSLPSPSRSISLPTRSDVVGTPSEQPSEAPTEAPTEAQHHRGPDRSTHAGTDRSPDRGSDAGAHGSPTAGAHGGSHRGADLDRGAHLTESPTPSEVAAPGGSASSGTLDGLVVVARDRDHRGDRRVVDPAPPSAFGHDAGGVRRHRRRTRPVGSGGLGAVCRPPRRPKR